MAYSTGGTVNTIEIIGRLGQDPEIKHTNSGKVVVNISLATNEKSGDNERTSWHRVTFWEKKAEVIEKYCRKGSKIRITGCLQYREFTDRDGNKRVQAEIDGNELTLLDSKSDSQGGGGHQSSGGGGGGQQRQQSGGRQQEEVPYSDDEDIPF